MAGEPSHVKQLSLNHVCKIGLKSKGETCMVQEPSHVKQLSPIHVCKIGLNRGGGLPVVGGGGSLMTHSAGSVTTQSIALKYVMASEPYRHT